MSLDSGPQGYELADWRRRINDIYSTVRSTEVPHEAWAIWHRTRSALFRDHPLSPLTQEQRAGFDHIPLFNYAPELRFEVQLTPVTARYVTAELGRDGSLTYRSIAKTRGLADKLGAELTLYWIEGYGGGLFLPFQDATSGSETYGGGRYLIDAIKGADLGPGPNGGLILDFNFAYHPSCALNSAYVCPLSPAENRLPKPVQAGERLATPSQIHLVETKELENV